MIEVKSLTKAFGPVVAVDGATFGIEAGEIVGFLGPNGAGKSTTIRMLTGYLPPTTGSASIASFDVFRSGDEVRKRIGYLPENVPLYTDLRVTEFLRFRAQQKGIAPAKRAARLDQVIAQCGLTDVKHKVIGALSRGFRQRVGLADAILAEPKVLILDEPTSGFDPLQRVEMLELIRRLCAEGHTTILFSSHILSEVQAVSKRFLVIAKGRIVADGKPAELIERFGENTCHVELASPDAAAAEWLAGVPEVKSVKKLDDSRYVVAAQPGADPREKIFDACVQRRVRLRELASDRTPLETIFARLVSGEAAGEALTANDGALAGLTASPSATGGAAA
jgi:ABC-2 type transport system ATP-binding protein